MNAKANDDPRERNDVLLPYQIRWLADESPIKVAEKSRRIGLTWTEAAASALAASASKGMDTWYLGYNRDMALEFVETADAWSRQFNKAAREIEEIVIFDEYGEDADEELLCVPRSSGGAYLSSVLVEGRMRDGVPVIRWELPENFASRPESERALAAKEFCEEQIGPHLPALDGATMSFFGEDFGRSGDLTVIWPF